MRKIKLLFLKNRVNYSLAQDIEKLKQWLISQGLEPEFDFKDVDLPLKFKDFGVKGYFGLDGIKQQIREEALVPPLKYQIAYFLYDDPKVVSNLANWTYWSPLEKDENVEEWKRVGTAFCEIVYRPDLAGLNGDILIHESLHAFQRLLMWKGYYILDTLDNDNNTERVVNLYKPLFPQMLAEYSLQKKIWLISDMIKFFQDLLKKKYPDLTWLVEKTAKEAGISLEHGVYKDGLATLKCESGLKPDAKYVNKDGTIDRGIAQFNSKWYAAITDEECYNPAKALPYFWKYFQKRPQDWVCYKGGKFKDYL